MRNATLLTAKFFFVFILFSVKDGVINYQPAAFFLFSLLILLTAHEKPSLPTTSSLSLPPSYFIFLWFSSSVGGVCSNESLPPPFKKHHTVLKTTRKRVALLAPETAVEKYTTSVKPLHEHLKLFKLKSRNFGFPRLW